MVEIKLTQIAYNGFAIGRREGKVYFVPYALPGEKVVVEKLKEKRDWVLAKLFKVIDPSPHRKAALCGYFGDNGCGGCHWQHINYGVQLKYKTQIVIDQLVRIGGIKAPIVKPTCSVGSQWRYRNHVQFHPAHNGWGFVGTGKNNIIPIDSCPLLHPLLDKLYQLVDIESKGLRRLSLRAGIRTGSNLIIVESKDRIPVKAPHLLPVSFIQVYPDKTYVVHSGNDHMFEDIKGNSLRISAQSFFQVNTDGAEVLVDKVRNYLALKGREIILDLYSGVGLFSLCLADKVNKVMAVESSPAAVKDARNNIKALNKKNVIVYEESVNAFLKASKEKIDAVVLDPPRRGCGSGVISKLAGLNPDRIVYVSCDPATLARDAGYFTKSGYCLKEVQPLDIFPQTYHIEAVALFLRKS